MVQRHLLPLSSPWSEIPVNFYVSHITEDSPKRWCPSISWIWVFSLHPSQACSVRVLPLLDRLAAWDVPYNCLLNQMHAGRPNICSEDYRFGVLWIHLLALSQNEIHNTNVTLLTCERNLTDMWSTLRMRAVLEMFIFHLSSTWHGW